ncbi:MAG: hypothetical protein GWO24_32170, partial [Akkermansiaceae bacterium]|nr:hypothetical protein [Akkermansiaceae bacterium]
MEDPIGCSRDARQGGRRQAEQDVPVQLIGLDHQLSFNPQEPFTRDHDIGQFQPVPLLPIVEAGHPHSHAPEPLGRGVGRNAVQHRKGGEMPTLQVEF